MTAANVKSTWTDGNLRFGQKYANGTANVQFDSVPLALSGDYSLTGFNALSSRYELSWAAGRRGKPGINADIQNAAEATRMIADPDFEVLGTNEVPGRTLATPAFSRGAMYLRTDEFLYKIATH